MIGDDPDAADAVLRHIYGQEYAVPEVAQAPWRFHLNVKAAADKYLLPNLNTKAEWHFKSAASAEDDVDEIHNILQAISKDFDHDSVLMKLAENMRKEHLSRLIRHPPYRAYLETDLSLLWSHFDELSFASELEQRRLIRCDVHGLLLNDLVEGVFSKHCSTCVSKQCWGICEGPTSRSVKLGDKVWIENTAEE